MNVFLFFQFVDLSSAVAMSFSESEAEKPPTLVVNRAPTTIVNKPTLVQAPLNKTPGAATSLITRTSTDNIGASSGATTLMVLTTSSAATANHNGTIGMVSAGNTGTPRTVKSATVTGSMGGAKTIVVMPVSNNFAAGDGATAKRFKIE